MRRTAPGGEALTPSIAAAFFAVVLTAVSQVLFKLGADRSRRGPWIRVYVDPRTVTAYTLLLVATWCNTYAYKLLPLKFGVVVLPFTIVLLGILSRVVLREPLPRYQAVGCGLILAGIAVYNAGLLF